MLKRILPITTLLLMLALPVAAASAKPPPPQATASIVGGHDANIADWPSISFVLAAWDGDDNGSLESAAGCTGTVIAPRWVITAAHCAFRPDGRPVHAMGTLTGVADISGAGGQAIGADKVLVDPNWDPRTLTGDALLIHLKSPSSRPAMKVAVPGGQYVTKDGVPNAAGWGTIDEDSTISTDVLQEAYLELQDDDVCAAFAPDFDPATQTCAGTPQTSGACHGDSGGPLIVWDKTTGAPTLFGLTSYGPQLDLGMKPCQLDAPAVYSWLPGFASFVKQVFPTTTPNRPPVHRPPVVTPPRDTTAPVLSGVHLGRKTLKRRRATRLSFDLSEASAVTISVMKKKGGRYKTVATIPVPASAGHVSRRFSSRGLKVGRYKLGLVAADAAGNLSRPVVISLKIVR